jgi:hypothetical protein
MTPSALSGTSPKYDMETFYINQLAPVVFGGGRRGRAWWRGRCVEFIETSSPCLSR